MQAIVLAGGLGTRLRSVVADVPKPMAPIAGRPFLELLLGRLAGQGFSRTVLAVGYLGDVIVRHFGDEFQGMELCYRFEEQPLGTGGAVRLALERCTDDHAFVFNGDTFLDLRAAEVEALWQTHREPVIVARAVADVARYGRLETAGPHVVGFTEKGAPGAGLINAGCYVLPRQALDRRAPGVPFSLEQDYFHAAVKNSPVRVFVSDGYFIDIGVPEDYARAQHELAPSLLHTLGGRESQERI